MCGFFVCVTQKPNLLDKYCCDIQENTLEIEPEKISQEKSYFSSTTSILNGTS